MHKVPLREVEVGQSHAPEMGDQGHGLLTHVSVLLDERHKGESHMTGCGVKLFVSP